MDIETLQLDAEERMEKALVALDRDFGKLRTGRATTSLVDNIKVDYYGTLTPIQQLASVAVPDSRTVTIQPWDRNAFSPVEKAILKSDLGLTPMNDGRIIRITVPPLTEERRRELTKVSKKCTEDAKVALRNIRRDVNDALKKLEKDSEILRRRAEEGHGRRAEARRRLCEEGRREGPGQGKGNHGNLTLKARSSGTLPFRDRTPGLHVMRKGLSLPATWKGAWNNDCREHIAVIMDGNGRWAKERGLPRCEGAHLAGVNAVRTLVRECRRRGIGYVTVYAFSKENWQRPEKEVRFLFELFLRFLRQDSRPHEGRHGLHRRQEGSALTVRQALDYALKKTADNKSMVFTLAISYSGREENLGRPAGPCRKSQTGRAYRRRGLPFLSLRSRNPGSRSRHTHERRKAPEQLLFPERLCEFCSTVLWPDFGPEELTKALDSYACRTRRFGRTSEQLGGQTATEGKKHE